MDLSPAIENLQEALRTYAVAQCGAERVEVHFLGIDASAAPADLGQALWEGDPCRSRPDLRVAMVAVDGSLRARLSVQPHLSVWIKTLVAAEPVAPGEPVRAIDGLVLAERIRGQSPVSSGIARVSLDAGDPLTKLVVQAPFDVESGARVSVRVRRGTLTISADGTTLEKGRIGDEIRVVSQATHSALVGVLVDAQTVELP